MRYVSRTQHQRHASTLTFSDHMIRDHTHTGWLRRADTAGHVVWWFLESTFWSECLDWGSGDRVSLCGARWSATPVITFILLHTYRLPSSSNDHLSTI